MLKDEYKVYEDKMKKSIEAVISDFDTVRAGRANASVLNRGYTLPTIRDQGMFLLLLKPFYLLPFLIK